MYDHAISIPTFTYYSTANSANGSSSLQSKKRRRIFKRGLEPPTLQTIHSALQKESECRQKYVQVRHLQLLSQQELLLQMSGISKFKVSFKIS